MSRPGWSALIEWLRHSGLHLKRISQNNGGWIYQLAMVGRWNPCVQRWCTSDAKSMCMVWVWSCLEHIWPCKLNGKLDVPDMNRPTYFMVVIVGKYWLHYQCCSDDWGGEENDTVYLRAFFSRKKYVNFIAWNWRTVYHIVIFKWPSPFCSRMPADLIEKLFLLEMQFQTWKTGT